MKKKTMANLLMVVIAAAILVGGIAIALYFRSDGSAGMGSEFKLADPPKLELVSEDPEAVCTIAILCDTIPQNLSKLEKAKLPYVPVNGIMLTTTEVEFTPGETVFDVLQRVCQAYELQIEYSWTPAYDSYYVESLGHLYEFDCGPESGWMFQVNGWFPNYGCSEYKLQDGDAITWQYTVNGRGADVGQTMPNEG